MSCYLVPVILVAEERNAGGASGKDTTDNQGSSGEFIPKKK